MKLLDYNLINGTISNNKSDKDCIPFKNLDSCYKLHYRVYRGATDYDSETVDITAGENTFTIHAVTNTTRYLEIEFFDENDNKFLPYNVEYQGLLKPNSGGNGIITILKDGTVRFIIANILDDAVTQVTHPILIVWDDDIEQIDSERHVTINFNFT